MKVVAIIHTYARDGELGSFMQELVDAFVRQGVELHLILANELVGNLNQTSYAFGVSDKLLVNYINQIDPAFVFTTNRAGITKRLMSDLECPILTWMVDRVPFLHHGGDHSDLFCARDQVITSSFGNVARLEAIYPILKGRVHFLPFATNVSDFDTEIKEQDINISFVGTYFYCGRITELLESWKSSPATYDALLQLTDELENDYDMDFPNRLEQLGLGGFCDEESLDVYKFKGLLANAISLNQRIQALDAVSDLGLRLYGTPNWLNVNQYSLPLLRAYQQNVFIKSREALVDLYQRSRISPNIPHHQAGDGLPYRVFDIMASKSLLVNKHRPNSDLFRLFGASVPVPTYRNPSELRSISEYYLYHEDERAEIVRECNDLMHNGFSFDDRVRQFFDIMGAPFRERRAEGQVVPVPASAYVTPSARISQIGRFQGMRTTVRRALPRWAVRYLRRVIR